MNSKYIKTKHNRKLEVKFFGPFQVFYPRDSQAYKLKLSKRWRIHDILHESLLEQNNTKKRWVDEKIAEQLEFEASSNNKTYKLESICNIAVYPTELEVSYLPSLYYLVLEKNYPKNKSTWEPRSIVQHFWKLINTFHKHHPDKAIATSLLIDLAPSIVKLIALPNFNNEQKCGWLIGNVWKNAKP